MIQNGVISAIFGILLLTLGHSFNMFLGNFESFLHSLRLHYVEFFTKFYTGNGREFEAFGSKVHNSEEK
jgi:V/A-type H+-transporting ATPase subunit I